MFNVGGGEVLVILLIAMIVLGPEKLPNAARQAGKYLGEFRRMSHGFQRELRDAMDLGDLGDLVKGTSKPTSPGGPTDRSALAVTPGADATPIDTTATPTAPTDPGAATGAATPTSPTTATTAPGDAPAVRKRSIDVDGPSASFG